MNPIGIMQGRLSPPIGGRIQAFPVTTWREEFERARQAGIDCIEWIYESDTDEINPLATNQGLREIRRLESLTGVGVWSACADYFMTAPLLDAHGQPRASGIDRLVWLIGRAQRASLRYIVLPFVDSSSAAALPSLGGLREAVLMAISRTDPCDVELHLETDLSPAVLATLLREIDHPRARANLDIGNSAHLDHDADDETATIGAMLGSVHVKDRRRGGSTVPLGTGDADFDRYFRHFASSGYRGMFILQVARCTDVGEVEWARRNRSFVEAAVTRASADATASPK